jgi:NADP-dependent aldehyde dehydrogenase
VPAALVIEAVNVSDVKDAVQAAEKAFWSYGYSSRQDRSDFLNAIADEIEVRGEAITAIGCSEMGLPEGRLFSDNNLGR